MVTAALMATISDALLNLGNGLSRIEVFGTSLGAVHDGVTAVELIGVVDVVEPLVAM